MAKWNQDNSIICTACNKRPASNKRGVVCFACYQRNRKRDSMKIDRNMGSKDIKIKFNPLWQYDSTAEVLFGQQNPNFLYHPASFNLGDFKYTPDFYDPINNRFIEVIGSSQRFSQLKDKITKFHDVFPHIDLTVCCADGKRYHAYNPKDCVDKKL